MKFRELKLRRDPACPICGDNPTIKELIDYDQFCGIQPAPAEPVGNPDEVTVQDMKKVLDNPSLGVKVIDVRDPDTNPCGCVRENAADCGGEKMPHSHECSHEIIFPLLLLRQINERFTELDPNQRKRHPDNEHRGGVRGARF